MAGTLIANSMTQWAGIMDSDKAWTGKSLKAVWWNSYQSRWDGLIPYEQDPPLSDSGDHWIAKDVNGTVSWTAHELEDRASGRATIYWDDAGKLLHVASFHNTTSEYWEMSYNSGTDAYSFSVGSAGSGETITGIARQTTSMAGSMIKVPNGDVWVAILNNTGLHLNRRTAGAWNGSVVTLDSAINAGCCTLNYFVNAGTTHVYVFCSEDDLEAAAEWNAYFIDQAAADPFTAGNWTEDTISAADGEADNHCDSVRDSNENIYIAFKANVVATETLIGVFKRTPAGTYTTHEVHPEPGGGEDRTRPCIAIEEENDKLYVAIAVQGSLGNGFYRTADLTDLNTWAAETELFSKASEGFDDIHSPQQDFTATPTTDLLFVAAHDTVLGGEDEDVYHSLVTIASAGGGGGGDSFGGPVLAQAAVIVAGP